MVNGWMPRRAGMARPAGIRIGPDAPLGVPPAGAADRAGDGPRGAVPGAGTEVPEDGADVVPGGGEPDRGAVPEPAADGLVAAGLRSIWSR